MKNLNVKAEARNIKCGRRVNVTIKQVYDNTKFEVITEEGQHAIVSGKDLVVKTLAGAKKVAVLAAATLEHTGLNQYSLQGVKVRTTHALGTSEIEVCGTKSVVLDFIAQWTANVLEQKEEAALLAGEM